MLFCFHSNLTSFFYVVFLFQIGASVPDNAGLGVPVDAGGLSGMGMRCDWLGLLDGVVLQALIDTGVGVCVSAGGVGGGSVLVNTGGGGEGLASWSVRGLVSFSTRCVSLGLGVMVGIGDGVVVAIRLCVMV